MVKSLFFVVTLSFRLDFCLAFIIPRRSVVSAIALQLCRLFLCVFVEVRRIEICFVFLLYMMLAAWLLEWSPSVKNVLSFSALLRFLRFTFICCRVDSMLFVASSISFMYPSRPLRGGFGGGGPYSSLFSPRFASWSLACHSLYFSFSLAPVRRRSLRCVRARVYCVL